MSTLPLVMLCAALGLIGVPESVNAQPAPEPSVTAMPLTSPLVMPSAGSPQTVLRQFAAAWASVTAYSATVTVLERKGAQTQNVQLQYTFQKPTSVTAHVDAGANAGVTIVWGGGPTVVAHRGSGFAALFKKTLSLHDPQVTTIRGSSIDQLSFGAILAHAQQEPGRLTQAPQANIGGIGIAAVTLTSAQPTTNAGLTREVVEISTNTYLPVLVLGYDGTALVRQITFSNVKVKR